MIAYIALFSALLSRLTALACGSTWVTSFIARFFFVCFLNIHRSGVHTALAWLVPHETAAVSAQVLCTPYNHASCHFMQSHIHKVYACLAVTCHLHFWQNDRGLLRATAVTRGWNGYRNKSQHRKSTLEKKILPSLLQGFEPATFQSRVRRSNHWAIPASMQLGRWSFQPVYLIIKRFQQPCKRPTKLCVGRRFVSVSLLKVRGYHLSCQSYLPTYTTCICEVCRDGLRFLASEIYACPCLLFEI